MQSFSYFKAMDYISVSIHVVKLPSSESDLSFAVNAVTETSYFVSGSKFNKSTFVFRPPVRHKVTKQSPISAHVTPFEDKNYETDNTL